MGLTGRRARLEAARPLAYCGYLQIQLRDDANSPNEIWTVTLNLGDAASVLAALGSRAAPVTDDGGGNARGRWQALGESNPSSQIENLMS